MEGKIPSSPGLKPETKFNEKYFKDMYGEYNFDGHYSDFILNAIKFINAYNTSCCSACQQRIHIKSILDVGCAKGYYLKAIYNYKEVFDNIKLQGIDVSEWAVKNADPDVRKFIKVGDIRKIPFPDQSFDMVLCKDTIEHISEKDIDKAVMELCRVSKRYVLISVMTMKVYWDKDTTHQTIKDIDWWANQFYKHGFAPIEARFNGVGFWEPVILLQRLPPAEKTKGACHR